MTGETPGRLGLLPAAISEVQREHLGAGGGSISAEQDVEIQGSRRSAVGVAPLFPGVPDLLGATRCFFPPLVRRLVTIGLPWVTSRPGQGMNFFKLEQGFDEPERKALTC